MKTIVLGPPGTGKTTTLLNKVDDYLKETDPDKIGYFAFTQKAAYHARDEAIKKFNLTEDDLPYFRTLHSLAFRKLGLKKDQVMQSSHYKDLGKRLGFPVTYAEYQEDHGGFFTSDSEFLQIINLAKVRNITLEQQYNKREHTQDLELNKLYNIAEALRIYKKEYNLIDFNDMILDFVKSDLSPKFDVIFIDEAQDLSLMQWDMTKSIWNKSEDTFIAGDDDQAIFKWAGADVDHFIALKEEVDDIKTLDQSYRIPGGPIHELSQKIINQVQNRFDKSYRPREEHGILKRYSDITQVDMSEGNWLVLSSANYFLDDAKDLCELQGWYYQYKGRNSIPLKLLLALNNWEAWRKGALLNHLEIKNVYEYLGASVLEGFRKGKTLHSEDKYSLKECKEKHGLITDQVWYDSFEGLDSLTENYIRNMRANGEAINKNPRIIMSTIHGAKGGEADKVLLMQDITNAALETFSYDPDELHRLFYTGATRAKRELHVLDPRDFNRAYIL